MNRIGALGLVVAALLLPAGAKAYPSLQFEAWPTLASDICAAPCYQVRMFLQDDLPALQREIQSLQMDVDVQQGAVPAALPVPPEKNANAGPGALRVHDVGGAVSSLPWDLTSIVGRSPTLGFDALMVHAASEPFSVTSMAAQLLDPQVDCIDDPAKCAFVREGLAINRIYLGFFNVVRTDALPGGGGIFCSMPGVPEFCAEEPQGPYFVARVGVFVFPGQGDLLGALAADPHGVRPILVPFLPEPSAASMLAGVLALLASVRRCV